MVTNRREAPNARLKLAFQPRPNLASQPRHIVQLVASSSGRSFSPAASPTIYPLPSPTPLRIVGAEISLRRACVFAGISLTYDPCPCSSQLTEHHIRFRSEGGTRHDGNLVTVREVHQRFIHSRACQGHW